MKESYMELVLSVVSWENNDVITTSVEKGDNTVEDDFFDE